MLYHHLQLKQLKLELLTSGNFQKMFFFISSVQFYILMKQEIRKYITILTCVFANLVKISQT